MTKLSALWLFLWVISLCACPLMAMKGRQVKSLTRLMAGLSLDASQGKHKVYRVKSKDLRARRTRKIRRLRASRRELFAPPTSPKIAEDGAGLEPSEGYVPFVCPVCSCVWQSHSILEAHVFSEHQRFMCTCDAMYPDCQSYMQHRKDCSEKNMAD